ncbi:hypothetical protein EQV77_02880 [Halobacillus fulvus]|nr:hypothetical protein EQV77_02880 [Halobacillus fulvus]
MNGLGSVITSMVAKVYTFHFYIDDQQILIVVIQGVLVSVLIHGAHRLSQVVRRKGAAYI